MTNSVPRILEAFQGFIAKHGNDYGEWFVGIAQDPRAALIHEHGFRAGDTGLLRQARSEAQAAKIRDALKTLGAKSAATLKPGSHFVYAYKIAMHTRP